MSAEQSRLRSAIQRIAREDPERSGALDSSGARGDQPGGSGVGESTAERDRICCDGSTSADANPGASTRDTSEGGQDGLDPNDPANLNSGPGALTGVVDCSTGQPVCLDGGDWTPPEGWDSASEPYGDLQYSDNWVYLVTKVNKTNGAFLFEEWIKSHAAARAFAAQEACQAFGSLRPYSDVADEEKDDVCGTGTPTHNVRFNSRECGGFPNCDMTEEQAKDQADGLFDSWPEDGCVNLAIIGGSIVGSKYDPENDGSYSAPRDEIELCDPENGTSILIRPSSDGGWKSIQSLAGEPDGAVDYGYLYAPDGKRIRQISPSEFRDDMV